MAISRVQGNFGSHANFTSVAVTLTSTVGVGNAVLVRVAYSSATTNHVATVTDDKGNSYNLVDSAAFTNDTTFAIQTAWLANVINTPQTITANFSATGAGGNNITADEFSGLGAALIDGHVIQHQASISGTNAITSGNIATLNDGDLIWGGVNSYNGVGTITAGTGFSNGVLQTVQLLNSEWLVQTTHGTTAATFSNATADTYVTGVIALTPTASSCNRSLMGVGCSIGWRASLLAGGAWRAGKAIEKNDVITRRSLILPSRCSLIGHNGGPRLED